MAQHDYVIANGTGAAVRSDLNNGLSAIVTQNSGATEPATTYAFMRWADTTAGVMKMRNSANNAWITLYQLDGEWTNIAFENGTAAAPSIYFKDSGTDTGFYSPGANQVGISTGGTARLTIDSNGNVDIDSNTLYVDATNNRVGLGVSDPGQKLVIGGGTNGRTRIKVDSGSGNFGKFEFSTDSALTTSAVQVAEITANITGTGPLTSSLQFATNGGNSLNTAMTIDSSQRVGIGTTSPDANSQLHVVGSSYQPLYINTTGTGGGGATFLRSGTQALYVGTAGGSWLTGSSTADGLIRSEANLIFGIGNSEKTRLDSSGRLLVGTSSARTNFYNSASTYAPKVQIESATGSSGDTMAAIISSNAGGFGGYLLLAHQRSGTIGGNTILNNADVVGSVSFQGSDGNEFVECATIEAYVDGAPGANDMPGRLVFSTCSDGSASPSERFRIAQNGAWGLAGANYGSSGQVLTSNGSGSAPTWSTASGGITLATSVATTSGTSVDFTSIPSTVKAITVMYSLVSTNGNGTPRVQLGTSSGVTTSGYVGTSKGSSNTNLSGGFDVGNGFASSSNVFSGQFHIRLLSSNTWTANGMLGVSTTGADIGWCSGTITLGGTLDRIRFTNTGGDTFDAGSVNIMYES